MATQSEIIEALKRRFSDIEDGLVTIPGSRRVMGYVVSRKFARLDHEQRQRRLWAAIHKEVPPSRTHNIGPITAMTPEEARLHVADAG